MKHFEKSLCRMTSLVVLFSYEIKFNISRSKTDKKFYQISYVTTSIDVSNAIKNCTEKFRFKSTLKLMHF